MSETNGKTASQTNQKPKSKIKKKLPRHSKFLLFAMLVALIPIVLVLYLLIEAWLQTGTPINGDRYLNDLNPKIEDTQLQSVDGEIRGLGNVEGVELNLINSTLRITIDMTDNKSIDDARAVGKEAASVLNEILPMNTYFTSVGAKKMYDIEIYVVDKFATKTATPDIIVLYHKSGAMEEMSMSVLSEPLNPDYVESIKESKEEEPVVTTKAG